MIISDLNYMEAAQEEVLGGFIGGWDFTGKTKFQTKVKSYVHLTRGTHSATSEADAVAAPLYTDGSSTAVTSTISLAGIPAGAAAGSFLVGSISSSTSAAATQDYYGRRPH